MGTETARTGQVDVRKTVNGAYPYRYAPFFLPECNVVRPFVCWTNWNLSNILTINIVGAAIRRPRATNGRPYRFYVKPATKFRFYKQLTLLVIPRSVATWESPVIKVLFTSDRGDCHGP